MATHPVTGGADFNDAYPVEAPLARGDRARVLDDPSTERREYLPPGVALIEGDVADAALVQRSTEDWTGTHRTNLAGSVVVLGAARFTGLLRQAVTPAARHARSGSSPTAAARSMNGVAALGPSPARLVRFAASPTRRGLWKSITIAS